MKRGQFGTLEEFVTRSRAVHGDFYDYALSVYIYADQKLIISCPLHGEFEQTPNDHWCGHGCRKCFNDSIRKWKQDDLEFVKQNYAKHGCAYCANALNKTRTAVYRVAGTLGLTKPRTKIEVYKDIPNAMWKALISRAEKKGLVVEIDQAFVWKLYEQQQRRCALTGWDINFNKSGGSTASIDRIDSKLGYIKTNVQLLHKDVNWCKNNLSEDRFYSMCKSIHDHRNLDFEHDEIVEEMDPANDTIRLNRVRVLGGLDKSLDFDHLFDDESPDLSGGVSSRVRSTA